MHSKNDTNHFFFDGYEIQNDKLDNIEIISKLLDDINSLYINGKGQCITIPYFGNKDSLDDGISGIVLGNVFPACSSNGELYSKVCTKTEFNTSLTLFTWFCSFIGCMLIYAIGEIIEQLRLINLLLSQIRIIYCLTNLINLLFLI